MAALTDRQHAHELIDRVPPEQINAAIRFLEFLLLDPVERSLAPAPIEDEDLSPELADALDRARASLGRGEGVAHDEIRREFGLDE